MTGSQWKQRKQWKAWNHTARICQASINGQLKARPKRRSAAKTAIRFISEVWWALQDGKCRIRSAQASLFKPIYRKSYEYRQNRFQPGPCGQLLLAGTVHFVDFSVTSTVYFTALKFGEDPWRPSLYQEPQDTASPCRNSGGRANIDICRPCPRLQIWPLRADPCSADKLATFSDPSGKMFSRRTRVSGELAERIVKANGWETNTRHSSSSLSAGKTVLMNSTSKSKSSAHLRQVCTAIWKTLFLLEVTAWNFCAHDIRRGTWHFAKHGSAKTLQKKAAKISANF